MKNHFAVEIKYLGVESTQYIKDKKYLKFEIALLFDNEILLKLRVGTDIASLNMLNQLI